jgi:hypothetical protein
MSNLTGINGTIEGHKLNLKQALIIQANGYLSKDGHHDYDVESVDNRIYELQNSTSEKAFKLMEAKMQREQNSYEAFLDLVGVPKFDFTWCEEDQSYIPF